MPIVNVKTMKGTLNEDLKKELHRGICDVMVETIGRGNTDFAKLVTVIIEEEEPQNFSSGGQMANEKFVEMISTGTLA